MPASAYSSGASHNPTKLYTGYFVSAFLLSTGLTGLLAPTLLASCFGMPIASNTYASGFAQCFGSRNLTLGILNTVFLQQGNLKAAATLAGLLAVDGALDAWVTWGMAGWVWALPHVAGAAVIPFVASWMGKLG